MNHAPPKLPTGSKAGLVTAGLGVLAVACCAGPPLIAGAPGSIAVGGLLGAGAGVLTVAVVSVQIAGRIRHRHVRAVPQRQPPAAQRWGDGSCEHGERLLAREDPAVGELVARRCAMKASTCVSARRPAPCREGERVVRLEGSEESAGASCSSRPVAPRASKASAWKLSASRPTPSAGPEDERCRAADRGWAIGDVTGVLPFTHVGMYQGRITAADIAGRSVRADYTAIPRVIFCDPELAAVGLTESQAREHGIAVATARVALADAIARPWTYEQNPRGELGLIADRDREVLVGCVGGRADGRRMDSLRRAGHQDQDADLRPARHRRAVPHVHRGVPERSREP